MPKRRVPSDEEDEASDNAHKSASEEEVVKKPKKPSAKSEKPKASCGHLDARDSYRPTAVLTVVPRHNQQRNKRRGRKLLRPMTASRLTKRGSNILTLGATDEQRFGSSKARNYTQTRFGKAEVTGIITQASRSLTSASISPLERTRNRARRGSPSRLRR